jgi:chaperonin cofactor prefoldin
MAEAGMDILMQLLAGQERMEARMDTLGSRMNSLDARMDRFDSRMDSLDSRMDSLDDRMDNMSGTLMLLGNVIHKAIETLKPRFEDHDRRIQSLETKIGR